MRAVIDFPLVERTHDSVKPFKTSWRTENYDTVESHRDLFSSTDLHEAYIRTFEISGQKWAAVSALGFNHKI